MERYDGLLFDCDNHYYEAEDAFMRDTSPGGCRGAACSGSR